MVWLVSGATVILKFIKKSMPRMGPATAACKKLKLKSLSWNWTVFVMNPQDGIGNPFAPLRRGPDGLAFDSHGIMLYVAPVSTKYLLLVNTSVRKINPASVGKCMAVAVAC
jgi:sugar lactone lactonase YvrE